MTFAQGKNGLLEQIRQLWSMLDELSENDPAGYRKLLETQMKESADLRSPPELHCSIRAETLVRSQIPFKRSLYPVSSCRTILWLNE